MWNSLIRAKPWEENSTAAFKPEINVSFSFLMCFCDNLYEQRCCAFGGVFRVHVGNAGFRASRASVTCHLLVCEQRHRLHKETHIKRKSKKTSQCHVWMVIQPFEGIFSQDILKFSFSIGDGTNVGSRLNRMLHHWTEPWWKGILASLLHTRKFMLKGKFNKDFIFIVLLH